MNRDRRAQCPCNHVWRLFFDHRKSLAVVMAKACMQLKKHGSQCSSRLSSLRASPLSLPFLIVTKLIPLTIKFSPPQKTRQSMDWIDRNSNGGSITCHGVRDSWRTRY